MKTHKEGGTPLAGAAGSARKCEWLIGRGRLSALCPCEATHIDPSTGSVFCESHAEDYEDVFGDVLHTLSPNAQVSHGAEKGQQ